MVKPEKLHWREEERFLRALIVAAFVMWNMGAAFLAGVVLDNALRRGWIKAWPDS